ncbi:uncharacterized protein K460DRAFT_374054 [Cucurbitaria berberidis CBS 394.84]|uniref:Polyketide synthase n=1 Tax=Cucurbitaria berberidis CBS 394.84 TaxID=1168544 RepID=A0A9P4GVV8_9PLEO|nr:uncharacterized protein K460DRAFT_374054 [Cucurbitaria berberidis CBS 394.84]KAF1852234.1 hypothetical protein K460DRAFT_374054 [Cucurbitaria berberidis CBS 394.84]
MSSTDLLVFGDQTFSPVDSVKELYNRSRTSVLLQTFLRNSCDALRPYAGDLVIGDADVASFQTALELADYYSQTSDKSTIILSVLLCIAQFGSLILHSEQDPTFLDNVTTHQYLLGLCTGLIPATAAAVARSVTHLVQMGPEIVCIALRLGNAAQQRSTEIEPGSQDWTLVVGKMNIEKLQRTLDNFNNVHALPRHRQVYISAIGDRSITISGPPSVMALLIEHSTELAPHVSSKLGITAAYHAKHLSSPDFIKILGFSPFLDEPLRSKSRVLSTSSGVAYQAKTLRECLHLVIEDVLQLPLHLDLIVQKLVPALKGLDVTIIPFGPCGISKSIQQALSNNDVKVAIAKDKSNDLSHDEAYNKETIAVIGMSGRFPGGNSLDDFWKVIETGRDVHKQIPRDRFDAATHCDPSGKIKNSTLSAFGCFIDQPGMFDTRLFNMSPREAAQTDPVQRQLLMVTYEALESAGYVHDGSSESANVGTFIGVTADDYREYNSSQDIDVYYVTGGLRAFAPGRLNYHFKWEGPSFSLDTACSSSAAAIDLACQSILSGKCNTAVAGGANVMTGPNLYAGLSRGGFLSPTGSSKTFDDSADGYCRGDAVGVVVLKRLSDAIAAGDNVRGVVRSVATNHSAYASSITLPHTPSQKKLFDKVLKEAALPPQAISYVEMHGTGTQAGDTIEMESVISTFGLNRAVDNPLYIGAVKANVGHGEGAAGVTSTIKAMLMFREGIIPPHAGIKTRVNTKFPSLEAKNIRIARSIEKFSPGQDGKRRVWINNFNASGGNTCLVVEEPPRREVHGLDPRSYHVVTLSAKTSYSVKENRKRLHEHLLTHSDEIQDVAYTTSSHRMHHPLRSSYVVANMEELVAALANDISADSKSQTAERRPIIFNFAGQGSQHAGMGKQLFETSPSFRRTVLEHDNLCINLGFPSFIDIITNISMDTKTAPIIKVHCGLLSLELALAQLWMSWGIKPDLVIGHSIGEYAALCVAGVLSLADTFFLVGTRARLMEKSCTKSSHAMVVINANKERVTDIIGSVLPDRLCQISCINGPESTVVGLPIASLELLKTACDKAKTNTTKLDVPYAFHSAQMDPLLDDFGNAANGVRFHNPQIPVASTLLGSIVQCPGTFSATYLVRQTREPVNFLDAVRTASVAYPHGIWIEHGPDSTCAPVIRATLEDPQAIVSPSLRGSKEDCWKTISKVIAQAYTSGAQINWQAYHRQYRKSLRLIDLPTYAFDLKNYWLQYEGTWALEKNHHKCPQPREVAPQPLSVPSTFSTTCLQQVESESFKNGTVSVKFVSELKKPGIYDLIQGHFVNGIGLCPSAVYTEMALTAAKYIWSKIYPSKQVPAMDVRDFEIFRPLVLHNGADDYVVRVSATKSADSDAVQVAVSAQLNSLSQSHARCSVEFGDGLLWARSWQRNSYLVSDRVSQLTDATNGGNTDRLRGEMVYKIFSDIVEYPEGYKGIKEFAMNGKIKEAVAKVQFRKTPSDTTFTCDPCWIDTIAQVPGFVLNGSTSTPPDLVFLSTGWESLRIAKSLSSEQEYTCHVRMQSGDSPGLFLGDASLFEGDRVVAVATGLKFHEVRKENLHKVLPGSRNLSGQATVSNAQSRNIRSISQNASSSPANTVTDSSKTSGKPKQRRMPREKAQQVPISSDIFSSILQLIAKEVGLKEEMQLILPVTLFSQCETVAQLREYFQASVNDATTPHKSLDDESTSSDQTEYTSISSATSEEEGRADDSSTADIVEIILAAIAKESGIPADEIDPNTDFSDLGVDSLMTIAVLGVVAAETGEQLAASIFSDYPTMSALRKELGKPSVKSKPADPPPEASPRAALKGSTKSKFRPEDYSSNVVLLQGYSHSPLPPLFLIADGAGSAAAYIHLPQLPSRLPVYALESPFLSRPSEYTCTIEEICSVFVAAIRATKPRGPYFLGGWSIGGIYSYETTRQLVQLGEKVEGVLLIDSPCPKKMEGLPPLTLEVLEETGIFVGIPTRGGGPDTPMPLGQKQHITGCVQAASSYDPKPLTPAQRPSHTYIIWSARGLFEQLSEKVKEASDQSSQSGTKTGINRDWLTGTRTSFDPKGWDKLLGDCECQPTEGDHFSCMNMPLIKTTGKLVVDAVDKFLEKINTSNTATKVLPPPKSSSQVHAAELPRAREVFENVRLETVEYLKKSAFHGFWSQVYPLQRRLVLSYVVEAFAELGAPLGSFAPRQPVSEIRHMSLHGKLILQLYHILEDASLISIEAGVRLRTATPVDATPSQSLYREILARFPQHESEHKLLNLAGSRLAGVLTGDVDFLRILFQENRALLSEVYTYGPMFNAASKQLSDFVFHLCKDIPPGQQIRILEIGGGLGGTTRPIVDMLKSYNIPFSYTFSDISGSLVAAARKTFAGTFGMEFAVLDVEKAPAAQYVGKYNFIFSTNCVHATRNLVTCTTNIRTMLRPDGLLSLVEFTENIFWFDIVFGLLEGWWLFEDGRQHVLASEIFWRKSLRQAGYSSVALSDGNTRECQTLRIISAFQPGL